MCRGAERRGNRASTCAADQLRPDRWFAEVKKGHTFVTAGPMLEFTVSGLLAGDEINAKPGERLKVHAKAMVGSDECRRSVSK